MRRRIPTPHDDHTPQAAAYEKGRPQKVWPTKYIPYSGLYRGSNVKPHS